jgi:cell division protease FtsH
MGNDNKVKPDPKKGMPGGFLIFLLIAILIILTVQNLSSDKRGQVAFSHQVEHLVNLDLIQKDQSRKTALNDNLVTFSGKFKDRLSEDAKTRYRFLELLNRNHELTADQQRLAGELAALRAHVLESADWFLQISGEPLPKTGYRVVDPLYNTDQHENAITLKSVSDKDIVSLRDLDRRFEKLAENPTNSNLNSYNKDLLTLIQGFRSPALGIGNEEMKQQLKTLEQQALNSGELPTDQQLAFNKDALYQLRKIVSELSTSENNVRLINLRSVRNYMSTLQQYNSVTDELAKNTIQLDKTRDNVAQVIWFFNNQELSSRALEKQDPEVFSHWYAEAKEEYEDFTSTNKGTIFKAPDQPRNAVLEKTFKSEEPSPNYFSYFLTILPVLLVVMR